MDDAEAYEGLKYVDKPNGKRYVYHRKTGTRIKAAIGTPEFKQEVNRLNGRPAEAARPGTLAALFQAYQLSPEFTELAPRTRTDYRKVVDYLRRGAEQQLLGKLTAATVLAIRDAAFRAKKRHFANYCVTVLRLVLKWGMARDLIGLNPAVQVPKLRRPASTPRANRPWSPAERREVIAAAGGGVKVTIALGMYCGMREG